MKPIFLFCAISLATACGGRVTLDTTPGGGGSGGAGGGAPFMTSTAAGIGGSSGDCPKQAPVNGATCTSPGLACPLPYECCQPTATCENGQWVVPVGECDQPCIACAPDLVCAIDAVCVGTQVDAIVLHECAANPCVGQPLSCSCAATLCESPGLCASANDGQVMCETLTD